VGLAYAEIILINAEHLMLAKRHIMDEDEVKQLEINMLADAGCYNL
jgi:hypothetical protein